jgi:predicted alpha/beta-fold hydrolase
MAARHPGTLDVERVRRAGSMFDFDEVVTSPLHGFAGADDYWSRASSKRWLASIAVPTLVLNARNDPFVPGRSLPAAGDVSDRVVLEQPEQGGHAGFLTGPPPGRLDWLPRRLAAFFDTPARRA